MTEKEYNKILKGRYGNNVPIKKTISYHFLEVVLSYKRKKFNVNVISNKFLKKTDVKLTFCRVEEALKKLCDNYFLKSDGYEYWNYKEPKLNLN